jgi:hypothetical protein
MLLPALITGGAIRAALPLGIVTGPISAGIITARSGSLSVARPFFLLLFATAAFFFRKFNSPGNVAVIDLRFIIIADLLSHLHFTQSTGSVTRFIHFDDKLYLAGIKGIDFSA